MEVISGYLKDTNELYSVTSGGICTAISKKILNNNGVVFGVKYSDDFKKAYYYEVDSIDKLIKIKGTKYIKAEKTLETKEKVENAVHRCLKDNKMVLFIGLPCDVFKVKKYLEAQNIDMEKFYSIDLICHGPANSNLHIEYINMLESRFNSKIVEYNVRCKDYGWEHAYVKAKFIDGQEYLHKLNDTEFGIGFNLIPLKCSYACVFKGNNRFSDITVGDYWGLSKQSKEYNEKGVSVAFLHSEKSNWLLHNDDFFAIPTDYETAIKGNPRYLAPLETNNESKRFEKLYNKKGLEYACKHRYSFFTKLKLKLKKLLVGENKS